MKVTTDWVKGRRRRTMGESTEQFVEMLIRLKTMVLMKMKGNSLGYFPEQ